MNTLNIRQLVAMVILGALVALGLYTVNTELGLMTAISVAGLVHYLGMASPSHVLGFAASAKAMTAAAIAAKRAELEAQLAGLEAAEAAAKTEEANKVSEAIKAFPGQLAKILGREVSLADMANMIRYLDKNGTLDKSQVLGGSGESGDRGKRLSDETKAAIRKELLAHCAALKAGTTPEPLSTIAERHGIQSQTLDTYKPTAEKVAALPGDKEVPASRMKATA